MFLMERVLTRKAKVSVPVTPEVWNPGNGRGKASIGTPTPLSPTTGVQRLGIVTDPRASIKESQT